ncbi:MAG: B12-binding domain-containing radical SAM protein [Elusimicrobia bacterium]|nr:B12-binding domain-containing radical SAM protein [Elusimicrobiota bacterium]
MPDKTVIFIEPAGSKANVFDNYMKLPLLGSLYLGTILHNAGYTVKIINENILGRKISPFELNADYLCMSCLTLTSNRAKEIMIKAREIFPDIKIIAGGIHPSLLPDDFISLADHIVIGEAETIIIDVIEGKYAEKIIEGRRIEDLDDLPLINYRLLQGCETMDVIPVMTSRGCPFDCNFCTVTKVFGKKFRMQSVERIMAELKNALTYFSTNRIFFYDDNFTASKKRANEIMDSIIKENINIYWGAQTRVDISHDEKMLAKMYQAGCGKVYIGFESIDDKTLAAFHKAQTRNDIEKAIDIIHKYGINIHGMFMLGEDNDTLENIDATRDFAIQQGINTVQFMIMTPFPGTQLYEKLSSENRFLHGDWDYYDGMHVVYKPKNMSPLELQQASIKCYKGFYSFERVLQESLYAIFNIIHDALLWDFKNVASYDSYTFFVRVGARYIISRHIKLSRAYYRYLSSFS